MSTTASSSPALASVTLSRRFGLKPASGISAAPIDGITNVRMRSSSPVI